MSIAYRLSNNPQLQGIVFVIAAWILMPFQDALIKWLSDKYPLHEIIFIRSFIALILTLAFVFFEGSFDRLKTPLWRIHLLRGALLVISNMAFYIALAAMPLAEVMSIFFVAPVFITLLSVLLLKEQVGIKRWVAVLLGLLGTLIMLRPGSDVFNLVSLFPVLAALTYALMQILTRKVGLRDKASTMVFFVQISFLVFSLTIGLFAGDGRFVDDSQHVSMQFMLRAWVLPESGDIILFILIGVIVAAIAHLLVQAYRVTTASTLAPFEYINLPIALLLGLLIWGDWPDAYAFVGISLIVSGGLIIIWRMPKRGA